MKGNTKKQVTKSMIMLLITCALLLDCLNITVWAGAAVGADNYNLSGLNPDDAPIKPTLTVSKVVLKKSEINSDRTVDMTISVSGAADKYAPTGLHVIYDSRLKVKTKNIAGYTIYANLGEAGNYLAQEQQGYGDNGFYLATAASDDVGQDGVLWKFTMILPEDASEGDNYPVQIAYNNSKPTAQDRFTNGDKDTVGQLMDAWVFTRGIEQGYIKIAKEDITATVNGYSDKYDGQSHGIDVKVTNPAEGATVKYLNSEGAYVLDESPTITDVADSPMTVYYQITADGYNTKTGSASVRISAADPMAPKDITAAYGLTLSDVKLPDGWTWADSSLNVGEIGEKTFKANYTSTSANYNSVNDVDVSVLVDKAFAKLTVSPSANRLTYNGKDQYLIIKGESEDGKVVYALGNETGPTGEYSENMPSCKNAGDYYIWYKVKADETHLDSEPAYIKSTISAKNVIVKAEDKEKEKGGKDPEFTASVTGLVAGESASLIKYSLVRENGEDEGTYAIIVSGDSIQGNYHVDYEPGIFTIKPVKGNRDDSGSSDGSSDSSSSKAYAVKQKIDASSYLGDYKKYVSDPKGAAKVNKKKKLITLKKSGTITITAYDKEDKKWVAKKKFTLQAVDVKVKEKKLEAKAKGKEIDGSANIDDGALVPDKWESSKPAVAKINEKSGLITPPEKGNAVITVYYGEEKNAAKVKFKVKVD